MIRSNLYRIQNDEIKFHKIREITDVNVPEIVISWGRGQNGLTIRHMTIIWFEKVWFELKVTSPETKFYQSVKFESTSISCISKN